MVLQIRNGVKPLLKGRMRVPSHLSYSQRTESVRTTSFFNTYNRAQTQALLRPGRAGNWTKPLHRWPTTVSFYSVAKLLRLAGFWSGRVEEDCAPCICISYEGEDWEVNAEVSLRTNSLHLELRGTGFLKGDSMLDAVKSIIRKFLSFLRGGARSSRVAHLNVSESLEEGAAAAMQPCIAREHIRRIEGRVDALERANVKFERSKRDVRRIKAYFILSARASLSFKLDLFSVMLLFFLASSIAVMGLGARAGSVNIFCEYLAYIFPLYAGLVAAGGLYLNKPLMRQVVRFDKGKAIEGWGRRGFFRRVAPEVACFQASALLVLLSLLFFVGSKGAFSDFYLAMLGLLGSFISTFSVAINYRNIRSNPTRGDVIFRPIAMGVMLANVAASVAWLAIVSAGWIVWPQWLTLSVQWLQESMP